MAEGFSFSFQGLKLDHAALDFTLNNPAGMVGRHLARRGRIIVAAAKRQVGVDTASLRASITMTHSRVALGQQIKIGSTNKIAYLHHEGSRPHLITARDHGMLRFSAGGRMIYTHQVRHPGTRPNRYLSDNLILVRV